MKISSLCCEILLQQVLSSQDATVVKIIWSHFILSLITYQNHLSAFFFSFLEVLGWNVKRQQKECYFSDVKHKASGNSYFQDGTVTQKALVLFSRDCWFAFSKKPTIIHKKSKINP